jgi:hypothetical protein
MGQSASAAMVVTVITWRKKEVGDTTLKKSLDGRKAVQECLL